jgi:Uma2 family endonuclease
MSTVEVPAVVRTQPAQRFVLNNVSWEQYGKFLEAIGENHVRVTYDRGSIEFMSPLPIHERYKHFFSLFLLALSKATGVKIYGMGSTTFRSPDADRGLEPDESYYIQSAARVRDLTAVDLTVDPPPDLAIEVDITSSVLNRMEVYAGLGIPEVWRCDGQVLEAFCLGADRRYERTLNSAVFPFLPLDEVLQLIQHGLVGANSLEWLEAAQEWLREDVLPRRQDS